MNTPKIDVIIPAFNEADSIGLVLRDIPPGVVREVIVCDNGSTDHTAIVAEAAGAVVLHQPKKGYGNACLKGIHYLQGKQKVLQPDIVVFLDGDYSDYPDEIEFLLQPLLYEGVDMVVGSRVLGIVEPGAMQPHQIFGNRLAAALISWLYGYRFTDLGPFRAIRWPKLLELDMQDKNFGWTVEMQVKAAKKRFSCREIAVSYRKRIGVSKVSGTIKGSIGAGYKILWTIFKHL